MGLLKEEKDSNGFNVEGNTEKTKGGPGGVVKQGDELTEKSGLKMQNAKGERFFWDHYRKESAIGGKSSVPVEQQDQGGTPEAHQEKRIVKEKERQKGQVHGNKEAPL